jgi:hypothetical protein
MPRVEQDGRLRIMFMTWNMAGKVATGDSGASKEHRRNL